jgi:hypothetical protein
MNVAFIADRDQQHELSRLETSAEEPGKARGHRVDPVRDAKEYIDLARI